MEGSPAPSERPTFAQAFASEGTATESPAVTDTTPQDSTSAPATEAPAAVETTPAQGPIPYDRHKTILDGAYKERDTYKQQLDALAWAQNADRQAIEQAQQIGQLYSQDRAGYIRSLLDDALNDPVLSPVLRSEFGRRLAQRTQQEAAIEPDIPVYDANGQLVSKTGSWEAIQKLVDRRLSEMIGKEVAPIKQTFEQQQAQAKHAEQQRQMTAQVESIYARASTLPLFKEHEKEIATAMDEFKEAHPSEQVYLAWQKIVLPKLEARHQAQALESLKTKAAAASGSVNPSTAAVASTTRPTSFHDKSLQW